MSLYQHNNETDWEIQQIEQSMQELDQRRRELRKRGAIKPMEPKDERLAMIAEELGYYRGQSVQLLKDHKQVSEKLAKLEGQDYHGQLIEMSHNRDTWKERALKAEETLRRSRAARRRK